MGNTDTLRRSLLKGGSLLALSFTVDGAAMLLSPREAHAKAVPLTTLNEAERRTLGAIGEVLVPGSVTAGLVEFVDHQLGVDYGECLLAARYLDVVPPVSALYRSALGAIDAAARHLGGAQFAALKPEDQLSLVTTMAKDNPAGWQGAPAPMVFFLLRSDAIDVYYGTVEAYARLGVPYMPHIMPERPW